MQAAEQQAAPEITPEISAELLEQHPELIFGIAIVYGLLGIYALGGIGSGLFFARRLRSNQAWIDVEPWSPRAWGLMDMLVISLSVIAGQLIFTFFGMAAFGLNSEQLRNDPEAVPIGLHLWAGMGSLAAMAVGTLWIMLRYGVSTEHVGFKSKNLQKNLLYGLLTGLCAIPLTWLLLALVSAGIDAEYKHPLIEQISKNGSFAIYAMGAITAAVIAPITEEFAFRVVLQGWLQSIPFKSLLCNVLGGRDATRGQFEFAENDGAHSSPASAEDDSALAINSTQGSSWSEDHARASGNSDSDNPYRSNRSDESASWRGSEEPGRMAAGDQGIGETSDNFSSNNFSPDKLSRNESSRNESSTDESSRDNLVPPIWPSIVSGTLFGFAHWSYGWSFLPLIVLGIVLGLVYRATHSIWPCILIHFMLNASAMLFLGFAILLKQATG
jgi:membrane protease YdiL (CAAX protease family)